MSARSMISVLAVGMSSPDSMIWVDNSKARRVLGWEPRYGLREIIEHAWRWHSTHPDGYGDEI